MSRCINGCHDVAYCHKECLNKDYEFHSLNCSKKAASLEFTCDFCCNVVTEKHACKKCCGVLICPRCRKARHYANHLKECGTFGITVTDRRGLIKMVTDKIASDNNFLGGDGCLGIVVTVPGNSFGMTEVSYRNNMLSDQGLRQLSTKAERLIEARQRGKHKGIPFLFICQDSTGRVIFESYGLREW